MPFLKSQPGDDVACPDFVSLEVMEEAISSYILEVEEEWRTGRRQHPETSLLFRAGGITPLRTPETELFRKQCAMRFCKKHKVSEQTVDWSSVVFLVLAHIALWAEHRRHGLVFCPETLNKNRKVLFGRDETWKSVSAEDIQDLFKNLRQDSHLVQLDELRMGPMDWAREPGVQGAKDILVRYMNSERTEEHIMPNASEQGDHLQGSTPPFDPPPPYSEAVNDDFRASTPTLNDLFDGFEFLSKDSVERLKQQPVRNVEWEKMWEKIGTVINTTRLELKARGFDLGK